MKIVHVFWALTYGGIETMLVNIANEQAKMGNDVTIMLVNNLYERSLVNSLDKNIRLMNMGRKLRSYNLSFIFRLNSALCKIKPDVIHLHGSQLYGFLLCKKLSRVACSTLHALPHGAVRRGGILGRIPLWSAMRHVGNVLLIDKIPNVFSISHAVHDALKTQYGVESIVVTNGIITRKFKQRSSELPTEEFKIVQVSGLNHEKKGQDLLIRAVAELHDKKVSVDFIGVGRSMDYLQALTKELNISEQVRFLGKRTQEYISNNLCNYDLFVQASRYEGFALTVAEAMAANVPLLVSSGQGPAEVCCNGTYGLVFENGNADDLAEKIGYIRERYTDALRKADKGRKYVTDTYDVSITARRYVEEYKRLGYKWKSC